MSPAGFVSALQARFPQKPHRNNKMVLLSTPPCRQGAFGLTLGWGYSGVGGAILWGYSEVGHCRVSLGQCWDSLRMLWGSGSWGYSGVGRSRDSLGILWLGIWGEEFSLKSNNPTPRVGENTAALLRVKDGYGGSTSYQAGTFPKPQC